MLKNVVHSDTSVYFNDVPTILKAIPKVGYRFVSWEGISNSIEDSIEINLINDAQITAVFESKEINIVAITNFNRPKLNFRIFTLLH